MANVGTIAVNIGLDSDTLARDARQAEQSLNHLGSSAKKVLDGIGTANERLTRQTSAYANELKSLVSDVERNQARLKVFQSDAGQTLLKQRAALHEKIDKLTPGFDKQTQQAEGLTSVMGGLGRSVLAVAASYLTLRTATDFVRSSIGAAIESEREFNNLRAQIERHGGSWRLLERSVRDFTDSMQITVNVSDELAARGLQKLISAGKNVAQAMDLMRLAADVAVDKQIELGQAIDLVSKASVGITRGLSQVGIKLDETLEPTAKIAAAMNELRKSSGAAAEDMKATASQVTALTLAYNEWKKALAEDFLNDYASLLSALTKIIQAQTRAMREHLDVLNDEFDAVRPSVVALGRDMALLKKQLDEGAISFGLYALQLKELGDKYDAATIQTVKLIQQQKELKKGIVDITDKTNASTKAIEYSRQPLSEYVIGWKLVEDQLEEVKVKFQDLSNAQANLTADQFNDLQEYLHNWQVVAESIPESEMSKAFQIDYTPIADEVIYDLIKVGDGYELVARASKRAADIEKGLRTEQISNLELLLQSNRLTAAELEDVWSEYYDLQLENLSDLQSGWELSGVSEERVLQLTDNFTDGLKKQKDEIDAWGKSWEKWFAQLDEDAQKLAESMSNAFEDNFFRAMEGEFNNLRDFIKSIVADITRSMEQELARLASQFLTRKIIGEPDIPETASNAAELASIEALKSSYDSLSSSKSSLAQFVDITNTQSAANLGELGSVTALTASYIALAAAKDAAASASGDAASGITAENLFAALPLAEGGLVSKPTFALIGEAGPEVVVPVGRMDDPTFWEGVGLGNRGRGGDNVIVNMTVVSPDLPSFKANQSQMMAELQVRAGQAFRRNR